jgi:hypothetical protein
MADKFIQLDFCSLEQQTQYILVFIYIFFVCTRSIQLYWDRQKEVRLPSQWNIFLASRQSFKSTLNISQTGWLSSLLKFFRSVSDIYFQVLSLFLVRFLGVQNFCLLVSFALSIRLRILRSYVTPLRSFIVHFFLCSLRLYTVGIWFLAVPTFLYVPAGFFLVLFSIYSFLNRFRLKVVIRYYNMLSMEMIQSKRDGTSPQEIVSFETIFRRVLEKDPFVLYYMNKYNIIK